MAAPSVRDGKLRALGVTSAQRSGHLPDVPTIAEAGLPGFDCAALRIYEALAMRLALARH
jgi:tripartite-type tricarboxylate transporter receptor subunit TctC